ARGCRSGEPSGGVSSPASSGRSRVASARRPRRGRRFALASDPTGDILQEVEPTRRTLPPADRLPPPTPDRSPPPMRLLRLLLAAAAAGVITGGSHPRLAAAGTPPSADQPLERVVARFLGAGVLAAAVQPAPRP